MADVVLDQVWKTYPGGVEAVRDVRLHVRDREFVVLVGPSGCGKSTTLRMIAGLEEISRGTISIAGRVVNDVPPKDRDIAMVFQNYALYPHLTCRENLAFGLKLRRVPRPEIARRVAEAAEILGIGELLDRKPKALSGGQRQRVAVGRAIVRQPRAFLFDEPLSNLDAKLRVQMRTELIKLHRRLSATMIYVTHDQIEAMTMGDRIVVMRDGVVQQIASPLDLYHRPANRFVASFVGSPPMNFLPGRLEHADDRLHFVGPAGRLPLDARQSAALSALGPAREVTLGIRPEALLEGEAAVGHPGLVARVEVVERMGAETLVHLEAGGVVFIARFGPHAAPRPGDTVSVGCDLSRARFFDAAEGSALA
jgi:multiple sugar transport system ATP-binding protein